MVLIYVVLAIIITGVFTLPGDEIVGNYTFEPDNMIKGHGGYLEVFRQFHTDDMFLLDCSLSEFEDWPWLIKGIEYGDNHTWLFPMSTTCHTNQTFCELRQECKNKTKPFSIFTAAIATDYNYCHILLRVATDPPNATLATSCYVMKMTERPAIDKLEINTFQQIFKKEIRLTGQHFQSFYKPAINIEPDIVLTADNQTVYRSTNSTCQMDDSGLICPPPNIEGNIPPGIYPLFIISHHKPYKPDPSSEPQFVRMLPEPKVVAVQLEEGTVDVTIKIENLHPSYILHITFIDEVKGSSVVCLDILPNHQNQELFTCKLVQPIYSLKDWRVNLTIDNYQLAPFCCPSENPIEFAVATGDLLPSSFYYSFLFFPIIGVFIVYAFYRTRRQANSAFRKYRHKKIFTSYSRETSRVPFSITKKSVSVSTVSRLSRQGEALSKF